MSPNCSPPEFESGTPPISIGDRAAERRVGRELAAVERGGRGHHLHRRARWVAGLRRAVEERRAGLGVELLEVLEFSNWFGSYPGMLTIALTSPVGGTDRDHRSRGGPPAPSTAGPLGLRVERRTAPCRPPARGPGARRGSRGTRSCCRPARRCGRARSRPGRGLDEAVADRVAEQRALRVVAHVDRVVALPSGSSCGDHGAVVGEDVAALDLLLLQQRAAVGRVGLERRRRRTPTSSEVKPKSSA